ncbi:MAG: PDZ domain-containing protein [Acidobacteriota bacterium]
MNRPNPAAGSACYKVSFPEPWTHYAVVEATFPTGGQATVEVFMAVWTPGSYLVREYARHVECVAVVDGAGQPLTFSKSQKNRWRIETAGAGEMRFSYRVYCREMSVRTNWVEDSFALLNGAPTFVTLAGGETRPHDIRLILPESWKTSVTGLAAAPGGEPHHYVAPDYDTLVDSPILAGNPVVHEFAVDGIPHYLANSGEDACWDGPRAAADLRKIVESYRQMWGSLPYGKYVFLNLITEAGGGLEHGNSVCMMTNRWSTGTRKAYLAWLSLASHEFFHVWNVKRLRPVELGPFDYENENQTKSLWVAEGITDYYAPLLLRRADLSTRQEYLAGTEAGTGGLSGVINTLQTTPGRLVQSVEQASFDAWIKLYRPDENSPNTTISYYTKGAVVAWLLDARIRKATGGRKSLDDAMRLAYTRYSGATGYTPEEFRAVAEETAGVSLRDFFRDAVESAGELDYSEALDWFGLRFKQPLCAVKKAWLGADTKTEHGRFVVSKVLRETPAYVSGINVDDEILAIGEYRVRADQFSKRLENYRPGQKVSVLVARREKLMRIDVTLGEEPAKKWQLEVHPEASAEQREHLDAWLGQ